MKIATDALLTLFLTSSAVISISAANQKTKKSDQKKNSNPPFFLMDFADGQCFQGKERFGSLYLFLFVL